MIPGCPRADLILMQTELFFDILHGSFHPIALHLTKEGGVERHFGSRHVAETVFDF